MIRTVLVLVLVFNLFSLKGLPQQKTAEYEFLSPLPGSLYNPPGTSVTIRFGEIVQPDTLNPEVFVVKGEKSGTHSGKVILARDQKTVIFQPDVPFAAGETVYVVIQNAIKSQKGVPFGSLQFDFQISSRSFSSVDIASLYKEDIEKQPSTVTPQSVSRTANAFNYVTLPADFPPYTITAPASSTGDGYIFLSNFEFYPAKHSQFLLILDNSGEPVYYQQTAYIDPAFTGYQTIALDFKRQPTGVITYFDYFASQFYAMNSNYEVVDIYRAGNGYLADTHELKLYPDGTAWLMIYDYQYVDMTAYGGRADAVVIGLVLQQLDGDKHVIWQWRSWDYLTEIPYTDSYLGLNTEVVDYMHGNAIERDKDGNVLISNRHTSDIIKINYQTGAIMWRLGGKGNDFTFCKSTETTQVCHPSEPPDEMFWLQHDIRRLPNGHITLFDNGNLHSPPYSRSVEYILDEVNMKAENVWEYRNTPDTYGAFMGNAQRLPNGNTVIGWGGASITAGNPTLTEVHPDGTKAFELALEAPGVTYRAFRFPWNATPSWNPTLVVRYEDQQAKLYYSWNGATEVKEYKIYGGNSPYTLKLLATQTKTGFENSTILQGDDGQYCYFRLMPVDKLHREMRASDVVYNPRCIKYPLYLPLIINDEPPATPPDVPPAEVD